MKTLGAYLESILDDDDVFFGPENYKKVIEEWIKNNYEFYGKLTISDDLVVDCAIGVVSVKNKSITSLTNGLFRWGKVGGIFVCSNCVNLTSLEGAPKKVGGTFDCSTCKNLTSLEGAPETVGKSFYCMGCENLKTLEGAPKKVVYNFDCAECKNLTSLNEAPEKVGGCFSCRNCEKLTSLKGAPKKVGGTFYCGYCEKLEITDSDREKYNIVD